MMKFEEKKFNIGKLKGISEKTIEEHLKLYSAYVNHSNLVQEKIKELSVDMEKNMGLISGLQRRFSFEYNGMRNHEIYFDLLSDGSKSITPDCELEKCLVYLWGSYEKWLTEFKSIATTRGIGWAILYLDKKEHRLLNAWVDEQHIGQLQDCAPILALDMWEHSFVADYQPSGKKQYIDDFFESLNWQKVEKNFTEASK